MNVARSVAPPAAPPHRARVLVVDDEVAIGRALERTLRRHHDVVAVVSGTAALSRIASGEHFDVILCDLMMPEMSGMEVYARLVVDAPEQAARMVFVSGGVFTAAATRFLRGVTNLRIDKPFEMGTVLATIARAIPPPR